MFNNMPLIIHHAADVQLTKRIHTSLFMGFGQSYMYLCQSDANTIVKCCIWQIKTIPFFLLNNLSHTLLYLNAVGHLPEGSRVSVDKSRNL